MTIRRRLLLFGLLAGLLALMCMYLPKGSAIGDRHHDFIRVVAHAKTLQPGAYSRSHLPKELQLKNLLTVHVDARKAYALELPSHPIDSNPIYIFVDDEVANPEGVIRADGKIRGQRTFQLSILKRRQDMVPFDLLCSALNIEIEIVVTVLLPQFAAVDEVVEVERVEAADVGRVDQVPGTAEYRHAQPQLAAGRQDAVALAQPGFRHEVQALEDVEADPKT